MSKRTVFWLSWVVALAAMICLGASGAQTAGHITVVEVRGAISPATADFIVDGIEKSESEGAQLLIIELDTPGGLDPSMRAIIQRMLASRVPIAVYVAPSGARAASAGTFILYASHIAAMTPASNLGAASPVSIGAGMPGSGERKGPAHAPDTNEGERPGAANKGAAPEPSSHDTMAAKAMNDAAAYIRSLAELRKRNPAFAEAAVREARSMSAAEALDAGVIDYIAPDLPALLRQVDGKQVQLGGGRAVTLSTQHARVERLSPDWRVQVLALLANPQVAVILMMLGIYGLFFEMMSPGAALPGVAGLICLLLGLYGLNMLPVNWAGVALLAVGLLMMVGEVFLPSFGALGVGGLIAFVLGGLLMTGPDVPSYYELSIPFLLSLALASALIIIGAGTVALRSRRNKLVSGHESMIGATGHIVGVGSGMVYAEIRGENWRVVCDEPLQTGDQIRVVGTDSLKLRVVRAAGAGHPSTPSVPA
jgi:Membrane-bound serine protease (ClpP class)